MQACRRRVFEELDEINHLVWPNPCRHDEAELFGNHLHDELAQYVAAPTVNTKLNRKTNIGTITGGVGVVASQADTIGNVMD